MKRDVYVQYGESETFWDCSFTGPQQEHVGVEAGFMRHISVWIDPETGFVDLNHGYVEDSPEGRAERSLFEEYRVEISAALRSELTRSRWLDRPEYDAFRNDALAAPGIR